MTSETDVQGPSNWTVCSNPLTVGVSLTSKPSSTVLMTLWIGETTNHGGESRVEGVLSGVYNVTRSSVVDRAPWVAGRYEDVVEPSSFDNVLELSWDTSTYTDVQLIHVCGLDDYYDDDDNEYYIYGNITSTDSMYSTMSAQNLSHFAIVLYNQDDDVANVEVFASGNYCSEAVVDQDITLTYRVTSKPTTTVLLDFTSSFPTEAIVTPARVSITPHNWMYANTAIVSSIDDFVNDGDQPFKVTASVLVSEDMEFAAVGLNEFDFISMDDPNDTFALRHTGITIHNASRMTLDGLLMTSEDVDQVVFSFMLTYPPQDIVSFAFTTDQPDEAVVVPNILYFTPENYAISQLVTVTGVDDELMDEHQQYLFTILPFTSDDPYYTHKFVTPIDIPMINRASLWSRLYLHISKLDDSCVPVESREVCELQVKLQQLLFGEFVEPHDYLDMFEDDRVQIILVLTTSNPADMSFMIADTYASTQRLDDGELTITFGLASLLADHAFDATITVQAVADGAVDGNRTGNVTVRAANVILDSITREIEPEHIMTSDLQFTTQDSDMTYFIVDTSNCSGTTQLQELVPVYCTIKFSLAFEPNGDTEVVLVVDDPDRLAFVVADMKVQPHSDTLLFTRADYDMVRYLTLVGVDDDVWNGDIFTGISSPTSVSIAGVNSLDQWYTSDAAASFSFHIPIVDNEAYGEYAFEHYFSCSRAFSLIATLCLQGSQ